MAVFVFFLLEQSALGTIPPPESSAVCLLERALAATCWFSTRCVLSLYYYCHRFVPWRSAFPIRHGSLEHASTRHQGPRPPVPSSGRSLRCLRLEASAGRRGGRSPAPSI